ncbi:hypothetical protein BH09SUM1_BH09SUM1_00450 [soil metagenome]
MLRRLERIWVVGYTITYLDILLVSTSVLSLATRKDAEASGLPPRVATGSPKSRSSSGA